MNRKSAVIKINALLELEHKAVGVKIVQKQDFAQYEAREMSGRTHYCTAVKCAMRGHSLKLNPKTFGCIGGIRALGLTPPTDEYFSGKRGMSLGLYKDEAVASSVAHSLQRISQPVYGVIIKPLESFEADPDVVLIAAEPRTIMRVVQGYTWNYGIPEGMSMTGNQAVCVECTVTPIKTGSINVSMLCSGTRYTTGWEDNESLIGIPFSRLYGTVEGIEGTVNAVEPDERKRKIETILKESKLLEIEVEYGKTYYKKNK